ncbi:MULTISPECIES: tetratricopeptide repeat protein [unclassified Rhizobium]|uniref:tetratricopeptide repeat protein n=1 Tax=unclassified Rhizobium TaxID=2613769 RepID=UPI00071327E0|nr:MULTISPECIES: tetratricopeptide repeat protein [unclassified Rhizobium]KQT06784.1 hypothetical protein ASG50_13780 [Rhizobium sp. Leaf386]KQU05928.1 hypothetical protein ASG68_24515 [Rhizobium sp. Leaf453]
MLHLSVFGKLELAMDGGVVLAFPRKGLLLLAFLITEKKTEYSRSDCAQLLWGDVDSSAALVNLRKMIARMRDIDLPGHSAPMTFLGDRIRLNPSAFTCDIDRLGDNSRSPLERYLAVEALVGRPFLHGIDLPAKMVAWHANQEQFYAQQFRQLLLDAWPSISERDQQRSARQAALSLLEILPNNPELLTLIDGAATPAATGRLSAAFGMQRIRVAAVPATVPAIAEVSTANALPRLALMPPRGTRTDIAGALIEDITIELCALRHFSVVAPYTAERIKNDPDKAALLAKHSISYLVDTSLSDDSLFAQMVFAPTDSVIWAERFAIGGNAVLTERKAITQLITRAISQQLCSTETNFFDYRTQPEAYQGYLAGSRHLNKLGLPEIRRARAAFRKTLASHAEFSPAASGMARTFWMEWVMTARGEASLLSSAHKAASQAIAQNPQLASGYRELGVAELYLGNVDKSLEALARAVELSPHYADAIYSQADSLVHASRPEEALVRIRRAIDLNPMPPDDYYWSAAGASYLSAEFQDAIAYIEKMSDPSSVRRLLAASWAMVGNTRKARFHRNKALELNPQFDVEKWLAVVPIKNPFHRELYREGLLKAGF